MGKISDKEVIAELKRIAKKHNGLLRPDDVVDSARPESSPIHDNFTWDNSLAAESWRRREARELIRVCIEYMPIKGANVETDVFVSLTSDRDNDGGGYRVMTTVLTDKEMRHQLLEDALMEMEVFQKKYEDLVELAGVFAEMRKLKS